MYQRDDERRFSELATHTLTVRKKIMLDFDPTGSFLASADEKRGLTILKRIKNSSFEAYCTFDQLSGQA